MKWARLRLRAHFDRESRLRPRLDPFISLTWTTLRTVTLRLDHVSFLARPGATSCGFRVWRRDPPCKRFGL